MTSVALGKPPFAMLRHARGHLVCHKADAPTTADFRIRKSAALRLMTLGRNCLDFLSSKGPELISMSICSLDHHFTQPNRTQSNVTVGKRSSSFAAQHRHYKSDDYPQLWALKDILMVLSASTTSHTHPIIHSLQLNQKSTTVYKASMGDQPICLKAFTSSTNETVYSGNSVLGRGGYNGPQKHPNMFVSPNLFKVII
jgi:hypothetical protein